MPTYILASQSPRRQQLLAEMGISFSVQQADIDETPPADINVYEVPQVLAQKKAKKIASTHQEAIVIAADTVVIINNSILNKPKDKAEAKKMLQTLSGTIHEVVTGVCVHKKDAIHVFSVITKVYFKALTESNIDFYIEHYQPLDKAGAYGIQDWIGIIGIEKIEGDYYNVMGLPTSTLHTYL